jgi:hypothetical protein
MTHSIRTVNEKLLLGPVNKAFISAIKDSQDQEGIKKY